MTVEEAINELDALTMREFSEKTKAAIRKGVSILEKLEKKEPALQKAKTSSNNNNSISNDNTKLKECQEIIDNQIEDRVDYYNNQLSDDEQEAFNEGQRFRELVFVKKMLKEATQ